MEGMRDRLDVLMPLLFSTLGLLALLLSIVSNTLTSWTLLHSRLRRKKHCTGGTTLDLEMVCQLLAIMLLSCVCWGPLLVRIVGWCIQFIIVYNIAILELKGGERKQVNNIC